MEHPTAEELAEFVYAELSPARQLELTRHVESCGECGAKVASWRQTRRSLQSWKLADRDVVSRDRQVGVVEPMLRWAVAAMVLIGVGYGVGRLSARQRIDVAEMKSQIAEQVRDEIRTDLNKLAATQSAQQQQEYRRALATATAQMEAQRLADYQSLRQDVETVAYHTQEKFDSLASAQSPSDRNANSSSIQPINP